MYLPKQNSVNTEFNTLWCPKERSRTTSRSKEIVSNNY